jgi:signal transduction histidine kinase
VAKAEFSPGETALIAELARDLAPALPAIARRWAPEAVLASESTAQSRQRFAASALERLQGFLDALACGNIQGALDLCAALARELAEQPVDDHDCAHDCPCESLGGLFDAAAIPRSIVETEIARRTAANRERQLEWLLCFARLWARMTERFAAAYSSAREANPRRARANAIESARAKSTLAASIAHEIRTPLNVILGYADLMAERLGELDDRIGVRHGRSIKRAGNRLLCTISTILKLSRADAGACELRPVPLRLGAVVRREADQLAVLARRKNIHFRCIVEAPDATVNFDEHCLSGALVNLIQNAIKFTDKGGVTVRVYRGGGRELRVDVRDTGAGIDPAYLPRLFEPFTRENSPASRGAEGGGLGLALARRYVELNGARIAVRSEKNAGSCFTIVFAGTESACATDACTPD